MLYEDSGDCGNELPASESCTGDAEQGTPVRGLNGAAQIEPADLNIATGFPSAPTAQPYVTAPAAS